MKVSIKTVLAAVVLLGFFFLVGLAGGLWLPGAMRDTNSVAYKARVQLAKWYWRVKGRDDVQQRSIGTARVTLHEKMIFLPEATAEFGGGMATLDGASLLVLDREGRLYHVAGETVALLGVSPPENGITALRSQLKEGRFGKVEINFQWFRFNDVLHVRDGERAWLLASFTEWHPEDFCFGSTLARLEVPARQPPEQWRATAEDWQVVTRTRPCMPPFTYAENTEAIMGLEAGGRLAHQGGTRVIWTSGSYERDDRHQGTDFSTALAQDDAGDYGKVMEVDFLTGESRHVAKGLRNPQGLAIDRSGRIWVADQGMRGGDELNLVFDGANFGFPAVTYGTKYDQSPAGNRELHAGHDGFDKPVLAFVPSLGTGSLVVAEGFHYAWEGDLIVGSFRNVSLYRVHLEEGRVLYVEPFNIGYRPRDMSMLDNGTLAVWTDHRRLLYYKAESGVSAAQVLRQKAAAAVPEASRAETLRILDTCLQCHSLSDSEHQMGPSLFGVCGRKPASTSYAGYSPALKSLGGTWTEERIASFVENPQQLVPGTTMVWSGTPDRQIATHVARAMCP